MYGMELANQVTLQLLNKLEMRYDWAVSLKESHAVLGSSLGDVDGVVWNESFGRRFENDGNK